MQIKITIPTDKRDKVIEAFASQYHYEDKILGVEGKMISNPQSKAQFALEKVKEFIKNVFVAYEAKGADTARKALIEAAEADMESLTVE